MDGQKVWNNILAGVKSQVSASTYKTWFLGAIVLDFKQKEDKKLLIIGMKNNFLKEQVETRYQTLIEETAKTLGSDNLEIAFVVQGANGQNKKKVLADAPIFSGIAPGVFINNQTPETLNPRFNFENLVVGPSNQLAFFAAKQIAAKPGKSYNPLFLWGPTGVGKTHLLQAVGNEFLANFPESKVIYATSEKFTNDYVNSLNNKNWSNFRAKYRRVDLLLVDDVQFFAGKESTQDEFFHTFNELYLAGRQVVIACDRHPRELSKLKERLASRFLGGLTVDISLPDLEMRMAIVRAKCQSQNIKLSEEIFVYIAERCAGGAREIEGALVSSLALTKLSGGILTVDAIKNNLEKSKGSQPVRVNVEVVTRAVCKYFGVTQGDIVSLSRRATLVYPRQVLMYLLRKLVGCSLSEIGRIIGGRDHSTVIHSIAKIEKLAVTRKERRDEVLRVEALIYG